MSDLYKAAAKYKNCEQNYETAKTKARNELAAAIREKQADGASLRQIAIAINLSRYTIYDILNRTEP